MKARRKVEKADRTIAEASAPARKTLLVRALGGVSELADQPPLISICALTFAIGLGTRNAGLARAGGRMLASQLLATKLKSAVKHRVDRSRPEVVADGGRYKAEGGSSHDTRLNSFPSGHTAGAVAVARAFAREYPGRAAQAYAIAGAVGAIQLPRSKHYLSDVAAGAAIGLLAELVVNAGERALSRSLGASSLAPLNSAEPHGTPIGRSDGNPPSPPFAERLNPAGGP